MGNEWVFPISPVAASRPRVTRYGAYFAGPYKRFREECDDVICSVLGPDFEPIRDPVDNFIKAIFDSMNKRLWVDDVQVVEVYASKQWAPKGEEGYFTLGLETLGQ